LIVNLDALGDVLMTTAMLPAIKRTYPNSHISWITQANARPLLENNPYLDALYDWTDENRLILRHMTFDLVLNADKNRNSGAFVMELRAGEKRGFGINENGAIIPLNPEAEYNYRMGIDDELKFRKNRRTGQDILAETWKLDYRRDEYVLQLTEEENQFCQAYKGKLGLEEAPVIIGFNTGCSANFPNKKMTIEQHVELIDRIAKDLPEAKILLLGGKEDTERNRQIKHLVGEKALETPTQMGLRKGICFVNLCDVVITGDSLGMHIAIALKKHVVAWFGPTCAAEIDLYGRGAKVVSTLPCSPCWNPHCTSLECVQTLDLEAIFQHVKRFYHQQMAHRKAV